jgi:hypothetical protein
MSISFACPECRAQIEVADEFAGHAGQCPRCHDVVVIPSPDQPAPILATVVSTPAQREQPEPKPKRVERESAAPRRRRTNPVPKQPAGPIWPWVVGFFGAVVMVALLISSFSVLVFWRRAPEPTRLGELVENNRVTVGRLEGNRAFMQNGVFQIRAELNKNDQFDFDHEGSRSKRYEIELQANKLYVLEMDSNQFTCEVRCERPDNLEIVRSNPNGQRNAQLIHAPQQTRLYHVYATSIDPALGNFTLTIREQNRPKPFVP